jgi:hypothetical protein
MLALPKHARSHAPARTRKALVRTFCQVVLHPAPAPARACVTGIILRASACGMFVMRGFPYGH